MGLLDIAAECDLTCGDARKIVDFVNKSHIQAACSQHPISSTAGDPSLMHTAYTTIARIESGTGGPTITYISLFQARGRYEINYDRLENLKREGAFGEGEISKLERLVKKLELVNERKNTLDRLLKLLAARQQAFFDTGDHSRLKPLSQRAAAAQLGINQSVVSRLIFGRSILTPWDRELPLKNLFLSRKQWLKCILEDILAQGFPPRSDEALVRLIGEKTDIPVSRRSVTDYRRELGAPCSRHKKNAAEISAACMSRGKAPALINRKGK